MHTSRSTRAVNLIIGATLSSIPAFHLVYKLKIARQLTALTILNIDIEEAHKQRYKCIIRKKAR